MLSARKQATLHESLKRYSRKYLKGKISELDESGTRLMINAFLTDVLGYAPIDEIKTEYMIRGSYADYVIQLTGKRYFLVEVKSMSLSLTDAHLRPALNFGSNEGIEWALLTNGRVFRFYRIIFNKTAEVREVFRFDLTSAAEIRRSLEFLQCITREGLNRKGLDFLWSKHCALDPVNVAGLLFGTPVVNFLRKKLRERYKHRFFDEEIREALSTIIRNEMTLEGVKTLKRGKERITRISVPQLAVDKYVEVEIPNPMRKPLPVNSN